MNMLAMLVLSLILLVIVLSITHKLVNLYKPKSKTTFPPGASGWPVIGETLEYLACGWKGQPEKFLNDRTSKYSSNIFRTNLLKEPTVVFCGASANKFVFQNENKLFKSWWPSSIDKIFPPSTNTSNNEEAIKGRRLLPTFFKPEALKRYVGVMDNLARQHFELEWENKDSIIVFPLTKRFTLLLACRIFLSIDDLKDVDKVLEHFNALSEGIISLPLNLPGTSFNRAIKASTHIREMILSIMKHRKIDLAQGKAFKTQDILSHMLSTTDEEGRFMDENDIANKILGLLVGGHDTASSACALVMKYLAEYPHVYQEVYKEQAEIVQSKSAGELLNWDDIQKMKTSWNVACEVLRLAPPVQGAFKDVLTDFVYEGFHIPKGWKVYWSAHSTHKNPEYFDNPSAFNPSRFEGDGPLPYTFIPFGGGPRMCPGKEYARLEMLVFIHNLVKRFRWETLYPNEKIVLNHMPVPEKGLPVRLFPY